MNRQCGEDGGAKTIFRLDVFLKTTATNRSKYDNNNNIYIMLSRKNLRRDYCFACMIYTYMIIIKLWRMDEKHPQA